MLGWPLDVMVDDAVGCGWYLQSIGMKNRLYWLSVLALDPLQSSLSSPLHDMTCIPICTVGSSTYKHWFASYSPSSLPSSSIIFALTMSSDNKWWGLSTPWHQTASISNRAASSTRDRTSNFRRHRTEPSSFSSSPAGSHGQSHDYGVCRAMPSYFCFVSML